MTILKKEYQYEYAAGRNQMYDTRSRKEKGKRMLKLLGEYFGREKLKKLTVLDIGCSSGIIDFELARGVRKVVCIDIDKSAIRFAKKAFKAPNLFFKIDDAMRLSARENTYDIVICTHVYEHVPNQKKLFAEIYRVLKPGGVCYLAATNRLWFWEAHYDLPFLSWLPKELADWYVRFAGKAQEYYETPMSYWSLRKLVRKFLIRDYTAMIVRDPKRFGYKGNGFTHPFIQPVMQVLSPVATYFSPTFFWLLCKQK